jgi:ABC-type nitrate/sulfonate/bicarbonate transport system substrate-binding protein
VVVGAGCADGGQPRGLEKVVFMAGYKPQADLPFVAAYVAQEKGFFREQGLDVDIRHSAGQGEHYRLLAAKQVHFTTAPAEDVLQQVAKSGAPFVAVALFGQRGDRGFAALSSSGIRSPKDWEGKRVGYKVLVPPDYLAMLKAAGVDRSRIQEVPVGFDPRILSEGKVDVYQVFVSNEPDVLRKLGFDVQVFQAADYGVPTLGLTYITQTEILNQQTATVDRFVKAALRGLAYAFDHEDEALDIVMKYAPQEDRGHMRYMFQTEKQAALTDLTRRNGLGWMTPEQWQALGDLLAQYGAIPNGVNVRRVFADDVLKRIYRNGQLRWP